MSWELILGIIGTITGVISIGVLIYKEFFKNCAKIIIEQFTYTKLERQDGFNYQEDYTEFQSNVLLKNVGNKNTTIEKIYFSFDNLLIEPHSSKIPLVLNANSSEILNMRAVLDINYYDDSEKIIKTKNKIKYIIYIKHTFGLTKSIKYLE
ncbi:MAG: hypothetical protein PHN22_04795 [Candidatus ainarchaeum sp.]|nr:hypothetical protein [Candidatus ainarchaeum sp.]